MLSMLSAMDTAPHHAPPEPRRNVPEHLYYEAPRYYQPQPVDAPGVFLAGGITGCPDWQPHAIAALRASRQPLVILNPKRASFPIKDPYASWEQFSWEQHHLHLPGVLTMFWFPACDPTVTTQPIAWGEFGQALGENRPMVVGADPDYPRVADVRMWCQSVRPGMTVYSDIDDVVADVLLELA